jgi:hypothetical protein
MSYMQALAVGWSIYWRQAVWTLCALVIAVPIFHLARRNPASPAIYAAILLLAIAFLGLTFVHTIFRVLGLRYSGFHLEPRRDGLRDAGVSYWEAAALSTLVNAVPLVTAPVICMYVGAVPLLGNFVLVLSPILIAMPLAGWLLTGVRIFGLQIELEDSLI